MARFQRPLRRLPLAGLLAALVVVSGCEKPAETKAVFVRPVRAVVVAPAPLAETATFSGDVWPRFQSTIGFRIQGKILERKVEVGQRVSRGDVLALLDPEDVKLASDRARSALAAAEADLAQARLDHDRYKKLVGTGAISQAEFDRRLNGLNAASSRVQSARAELELARNQTDYAALKADADGVVVAVEAEAGEVVGAGQAVVRVAQTAAKDVVVAVPESRLGDIKAATRIEVSLWAEPGAMHKGTVREIAPRADAGTRTYAVKIAVEDPKDEVQLGMTANVMITTGAAGEAIMVPPSALTQQGDAPAVWVVAADAGTGTGKVSLRPIRIAAYREDSVVVAEGLAAGEVVVTAGANKLAEGQEVRLLDKAARL